MKHFLFAGVIALLASPQLMAADVKTWEGTWNNRKFNTRGPLKCVATETKKGVWTATFTGKFQGDPFKYQATFFSKQVGRVTRLSGKAVIRGHDYQWTGTIRGTQFDASYKSSVGYFGTFNLKEVK